MALIEIYVNEYLGKIFYYCLKKTGKENDAAELASNINFEVIKALQKGIVPDQFSQWVWTVAKNQWSKWAKKQYFSNLEQVDIQDYEQELASEENAFDKYTDQCTCFYQCRKQRNPGILKKFTGL